jgi:hypothetical protein
MARRRRQLAPIRYDAHFHHLLAAKLEASGCGIRRTESHFELASVSRLYN